MKAARQMACTGCGVAIQVVTCSTRCQPCRQEAFRSAKRAQYQKHKDKIATRHKGRYADNPDKYRGYHYKHRYGMTREQVEAMHAAQGKACAICEKPIPLTGESRTKLAVVDHCHSSGKVRGLLCQPCNMLLGNASDRPEVLRAAITYLERA